MTTQDRGAFAGLAERLDDRTADVAVVGLGHVGLPLAQRCSAAGFKVTGFDTDASVATALEHGAGPVGPLAVGEVAEMFACGFRAMSDPSALAGADVVVICVPTPLAGGDPDLRPLRRAAGAAGEALANEALVVVESTVYPGCTREVVRPVLEHVSRLRCGSGFLLGYSPERIDPGNDRFGLANTPKLVAGADPLSAAAVERFYSAVVDKVVPCSSIECAELAKLIENCYRAVNVGFVNELATAAGGLGVDVWEAVGAAATKPFGFAPFWPGPGVGGHCLPVDPVWLDWQVRRLTGSGLGVLGGAVRANAAMPAFVVRRCQELVGRAGARLEGVAVCQLGYAYKSACSDVRHAPGAEVAHRLVGLGAELAVCDPHVASAELPQGALHAEPTPRRLQRADLVVWLVDHPAFEPTSVARHAPLALDCTGALRGLPYRGQALFGDKTQVHPNV